MKTSKSRKNKGESKTGKSSKSPGQAKEHKDQLERLREKVRTLIFVQLYGFYTGKVRILFVVCSRLLDINFQLVGFDICDNIFIS